MTLAAPSAPLVEIHLWCAGYLPAVTSPLLASQRKQVSMRSRRQFWCVCVILLTRSVALHWIADDPCQLGPFCQWRSCLGASMKATTSLLQPKPVAEPAIWLQGSAGVAAQRLRSSSDSATAPPTEILFGLGEKAEEFCEGHARLKNMLERAPSDADNGQAAVEVSRYLPRRWLAAAGGPASPKKKKGVCPCFLCLECWFLKCHAAFARVLQRV